MADAIRRRRPLLLLAAIEYATGIAYYWTGVGPLTYNGVTWTGLGRLGQVAPISHNSDLTIQEITFTLAGISQNEISKISDDVRNLSGEVWLACLSDEGTVVPDPYQLLQSQLDYQTFSIDDSGTATIAITARTGFYTLDRGINDAWTTEQQKLTYPADTGLDLISGLQNQAITWTPV